MELVPRQTQEIFTPGLEERQGTRIQCQLRGGDADPVGSTPQFTK